MEKIQKRLNDLLKQKELIEQEIETLQRQLLVKPSFSKNDKIELFKSLFIARDDIYAKKWVSKDKRKASYFPVTQTFQGDDYIPLSNQEIEQHLRGAVQLASYTISKTNKSKYLVLQILERNRVKLHLLLTKLEITPAYSLNSNKDLLVWIFFEAPVLAKEAKALAQRLLQHANISAKIFPNQAFVNASSLGAYLELPLHLGFRKKGLTLFMDEKNQPIEDQWSYLFFLKKLSLKRIKEIAQNDEKVVENWDKTVLETVEYPTFKLNVILYDWIYIPTHNCSKSFLNRLKALATFDNPQVKTLLALRKPLYNTPRTIKSFEEDEKYLKLPRGLLEQVKTILKSNHIKFDIEDKRQYEQALFPKIRFDLRPQQCEAIEKILEHDFSICVAPPGFGKTLIGAKMIELRAATTLVVVNKNMLLDQWIERFVDYFGMDKKEIGFLGKSKNRLNGKLDIATMQSLKNRPELIENYSFVIVDECHHIPAVTFELIIKQFCGQHVLGLSATPNRKDGLEPILFQQLGNIAYAYRKKRTITHQLKVVKTDFVSDSDNYAQLINELSVDKVRNSLIINEIKNYHERKILVLTDRIEHIKSLEELLNKNNLKYIAIHGSLSKKEQKERMNAVEKNELILATSSYFGEGIDFPHLNTILFATPISYYGRLVQYLGRVGRDGQACLAIDLLDTKHAMLNSAYKKRLEGYKQMHYKHI